MSRVAGRTTRWQEIREQLRAELPAFDYGSRFYTITDICAKFEVSTITARRVLTEMQNEGLVEKIQRRGTVVRQVSRALRIRMLLAAKVRPEQHTLNPIYRRLIAGATQAAERQRADFDLISESNLETLFSRRDDVFGFLLPIGIASRSVDFLRERNLPFVFLDPQTTWAGLPHARANRIRAGYIATRHLLDLGHRRIAFIIGPISRRNFRDRLNGYRKALREAGIRFDWGLIEETSALHPDEGDSAMANLMGLKDPPTAVITGDDNRALLVLETCRRTGIRVPEDLSVVGFPNYPESSLTDPPLTVVDPRYELIAEAAMKLLFDQMLENADPLKQRVVIQPELVQRRSTGPIRNTLATPGQGETA